MGGAKTQFSKQVAFLSEAQRRFLATRQMCSVLVCRCVDGAASVLCQRASCSVDGVGPCTGAVACFDNYCGECGAEWLDTSGSPACE